MLGATYLAVCVQDLGLVCVDVVAQVGVVACAEGGWHDGADVLALQLPFLVPARAPTQQQARRLSHKAMAAVQKLTGCTSSRQKLWGPSSRGLNMKKVSMLLETTF
jgi:hypothetical protein